MVPHTLCSIRAPTPRFARPNRTSESRDRNPIEGQDARDDYQSTNWRNVVHSGDNYRSLPSARAPFLGLFTPPRNHRRLPSSHRVARKTLLPCSFVRAHVNVCRASFQISSAPLRRSFSGCPRSRGNFAKSHFDGSRLVGLSPHCKKKAKARQVARLRHRHLETISILFFGPTDRFNRPVSMKKSNHERSIRTQKGTNGCTGSRRNGMPRVWGICGFLCVKSRARDGLSLRGIREFETSGTPYIRTRVDDG